MSDERDITNLTNYYKERFDEHADKAWVAGLAVSLFIMIEPAISLTLLPEFIRQIYLQHKYNKFNITSQQ